MLATLVGSIVATPIVVVVLPIGKSLPSSLLGSDHLLDDALKIICCFRVVIAESLKLPFGLDLV